VETTTGYNGGGIDEKFIKSNEEKIKQEIQKAKEGVATDKSSGVQSSHDSTQGTPDTKHNGEAKQEVFDPAKEYQSIMSLSPIVIFSKTYCGFSKSLKNLLKTEYEVTPDPTIVELDKHKNGRELQDYIASKTGRKTVPNLFVNGISRGGSDEMKKLHNEGKLLTSLNTWGEKNIKVTKINAPANV
jgi:glutaredoxin